jgi:hypothetical protein
MKRRSGITSFDEMSFDETTSLGFWGTVVRGNAVVPKNLPIFPF